MPPYVSRTRQPRAQQPAEIIDGGVEPALGVSPRLAAQRAARMARGDNDRSQSLKLGIDESKLDTENFVYRFANEGEGAGRLRHLTTQKDYELVSNSDLGEPTEDMGDAVTRIVGARKDGSAERAVLVRKPKDWYEADKAKDLKPNEDAMAAIRRGHVPNSSEGPGLTSKDHAYIPESGIQIKTPRTGGFEP